MQARPSVDNKPNLLRATDRDALRLAKTLIRTARSGALATLDPASGWPVATRVGVSTDIDGAPVILISALTAHAAALRADPRCALLLGQAGRGDPLAHPRISVRCSAREVSPGGAEDLGIRARYLAHQPKARLYAGLPDFRFVRLEPVSISMNAGFGKAYAPAAPEVLSPVVDGLAEVEPGAIEHMNGDHAVAVGLIARHFAGVPNGAWRIVGIDAEGVDLARGDDVRRVFFPAPLGSAAQLRSVLARMAAEARAALGS